MFAVVKGAWSIGLLLCAAALLLGACGTPSASVDPSPTVHPTAGPSGVDAKTHELPDAKVAFNAPKTMQLNHTRQVELALSPALSETALKDALADREDAETATVKRSDVMKATLSGAGFDITADRDAEQAVGSGVTRWRWDVTPTSGGRKRLYLTVTAYIDVNGRQAPVPFETLARAIDVSVSIPQRVSGFLGDSWQWIASAILIPLGGLAWRKRKRAQQAAQAARPS
jgi:hypothetical protein